MDILPLISYGWSLPKWFAPNLVASSGFNTLLDPVGLIQFSECLCLLCFSCSYTLLEWTCFPLHTQTPFQLPAPYFVTILSSIYSQHFQPFITDFGFFQSFLRLCVNILVGCSLQLPLMPRQIDSDIVQNTTRRLFRNSGVRIWVLYSIGQCYMLLFWCCRSWH